MDAAGHPDRHAGPRGGVDGRHRALVTGKPSHEADIGLRPLAPLVPAGVQAMMDHGGRIVSARLPSALVPRDADVVHSGEVGVVARKNRFLSVVNGVDQRQTGGQAAERECAGGVGMHHVVAARGHLAHRPGHVVELGEGVGRPDRLIVERLERGPAPGVAGGEEGDLVPPVQQSFHQLVNDQLGPAVSPSAAPE